MITVIIRSRSAALTDEDVNVWAGLHLDNDVLFYWLRRRSLPADQRDAEKMFAETDARAEPRDRC